MTTSPCLCPRARGAVLIEAMAAGAILVVGLLGALQTILFAAQQNSFANKMARGSQIARQVRVGLELRGWSRANALTGSCLSGVDRELAGGLETLVPPPCVIDLDVPAISAQLVPGYSAEDSRLYRKVAVFIPGTGVIDTYAVVVSWNELRGRHFSRQMVALYNPAAGAQPLGVEF